MSAVTHLYQHRQSSTIRKELTWNKKSTLHVNWHNNNNNNKLKVARIQIKMEINRPRGRKKEKYMQYPGSLQVNFNGAVEDLIFWHRSITFNSNKSPTWCNSYSVPYPDVCLQLNRFRAFSRPSSGAQWLQWQPLVLPTYRGDRPCCVRGRAGRLADPTTNTARLSPRYEGKTRGCHSSNWAPDDGRENARNMLSCKQTSG
jgi:hypothetical protein